MVSQWLCSHLHLSSSRAQTNRFATQFRFELYRNCDFSSGHSMHASGTLSRCARCHTMRAKQIIAAHWVSECVYLETWDQVMSSFHSHVVYALRVYSIQFYFMQCKYVPTQPPQPTPPTFTSDRDQSVKIIPLFVAIYRKPSLCFLSRLSSVALFFRLVRLLHSFLSLCLSLRAFVSAVRCMAWATLIFTFIFYCTPCLGMSRWRYYTCNWRVRRYPQWYGFHFQLSRGNLFRFGEVEIYLLLLFMQIRWSGNRNRERKSQSHKAHKPHKAHTLCGYYLYFVFSRECWKLFRFGVLSNQVHKIGREKIKSELNICNECGGGGGGDDNAAINQTYVLIKSEKLSVWSVNVRRVWHVARPIGTIMRNDRESSKSPSMEVCVHKASRARVQEKEREAFRPSLSAIWRKSNTFPLKNRFKNRREKLEAFIIDEKRRRSKSKYKYSFVLDSCA